MLIFLAHGKKGKAHVRKVKITRKLQNKKKIKKKTMGKKQRWKTKPNKANTMPAKHDNTGQ